MVSKISRNFVIVIVSYHTNSNKIDATVYTITI